MAYGSVQLGKVAKTATAVGDGDGDRAGGAAGLEAAASAVGVLTAVGLGELQPAKAGHPSRVRVSAARLDRALTAVATESWPASYRSGLSVTKGEAAAVKLSGVTEGAQLDPKTEFRQLYDQEFHSVYRSIRAVVLDTAAAEDLTSRRLAEAHRHQPRDLPPPPAEARPLPARPPLRGSRPARLRPRRGS